MKRISLYEAQDTYLTRLHPFTKVCYIITAIGVPMLLQHTLAYVICIVCSILLLTTGRLLKKTIPLLMFSFSMLLTVFVIQGLFYKGNASVLFRLGGIPIYKEGLRYAASIGCNVWNMLLSFAVFVLTTKPEELVEELEKKGLPPKIGYMICSVFQIVPQMMTMTKTISDAQRSRGLEIEGNFVVRMRAFLPLMSPVVMSSLMMTRERALALEVRCFGVKGKKTFLSERTKNKWDGILCSTFCLFFILALIWRVGS